MENIDIINKTNNHWQPVWGENSENLINRLDLESEEKEVLKNETIKILFKCNDPNNGENSQTGLVFGHIQSGKTMSFTTLIALAVDNGYKIIIVISGTTTELSKQTYDRLSNDLDIDNNAKLKIESNLTDEHIVQNTIDNWTDKKAPDMFKEILLVTVLKNHSHLKKILKIFTDINTNNLPILIIDDEADQASLNTFAKANNRKDEDKKSTIYKHITELKSTIPNHAFVQYTATPQAPIFINTVDILSPNFVELVSPGNGYIGGKEFFDTKKNQLIVNIPPKDIETDKMPKSLKEAMMFYFVGASCLFHQKIKDIRSMMVHPHIKTAEHKKYYDLIVQQKSHWLDILNRSNADKTKIKLTDEFKHIFIGFNTKDIEFEKILNMLPYLIQNTNIVELNSSSTGNKPNWNRAHSHILIGGTMLDRGFTVKNLTVSYMPRSKGVGNADTIQQRARFFGYKKDYLDFCRVYLEEEVSDLFTEYVKHEESLKEGFKDWQKSGKPVNQLDRYFILDRNLKPTRVNVLSESPFRSEIGNNKWIQIRVPHDSTNIVKNNNNIYNNFYNKYENTFQEDIGHISRTKDQKHFTTHLPAQELFNEFLDQLKFTRENEAIKYLNIKSIIGNVDEPITIYIMSKGSIRVRSLLKNTNNIENLFQGKNPRAGEIIYPGDDKIKNKDNITIQIHKVNIRDTDFNDVVSLAIWIPNRFRQDTIIKNV